MQHMDLSAQYGGQQGHADVHAIFCLAEICRPRVRVHLRTERKYRGKKSKLNGGSCMMYVTEVLHYL